MCYRKGSLSVCLSVTVVSVTPIGLNASACRKFALHNGPTTGRRNDLRSLAQPDARLHRYEALNGVLCLFPAELSLVLVLPTLDDGQAELTCVAD